MAIMRRSTRPSEEAVRIHDETISDELDEAELQELGREAPSHIDFFVGNLPDTKEEILGDDDKLRQLQRVEQTVMFSLACNNQTPHPKDMNVGDLLRGVQYVQNANDPQFGRIEEFYRGRIRSPLTAIRAFCVLNEGGPKMANACPNTTCPLWAFRTGKNGFFGRR